MFGPKFDIISPVWLQIVRQSKEQYVLRGTHDIDTNWIEDVRKAGPKNQKGKSMSLFSLRFYLMKIFLYW